ncbi:MAG: hypothetical protein OJJ54_06620 [Pseudonocardia sp.]|nr:hypothetical protein [Pseudonocardia sp.]
MQISRTTRRIATVGAFAVPLAFAATGLANAGESHHGGGHCGGQFASQDGGLLGLDADVSPALNVGGLLNSGPVSQKTVQLDESNSGIVQSGGGHSSGGFDAFQVDDLVNGTIGVNPAVNIGGVLNSGPVHQSTVQVDRSNSGIVQDGSGHGGGHGGGHGWWHGGGTSFAGQNGGLLGLDLDVSPAINLGGILSGGAVSQSTVQQDSSNSGILQG